MVEAQALEALAQIDAEFSQGAGNPALLETRRTIATELFQARIEKRIVSTIPRTETATEFKFIEETPSDEPPSTIELQATSTQTIERNRRGWRQGKLLLRLGEVPSAGLTPNFPVLYAIVPDFLQRFKNHPDVCAIASLYHTTNIPGVLELITQLGHLVKVRNQPAVNLNRSIQRLSGMIPEEIPQVLAEFDGRLPLALGPLSESSPVGGAADLKGTFPQFRLPYGSLECTRNFLLSTQRRIEEQLLDHYSIELSGRVSPGLLLWASGSGVEDPGPIPDIEITYRLTLPSGLPYRFVLHAARDYSLKPPNAYEMMSDQDREAVLRLGEYFRDTEHKRSWELFSHFRESDYPDWVRPILNNTESSWALATYREVQACWGKSLIAQLQEKGKSTGVGYRKADWISEAPLDQAEFKAFLAGRVERMPFEQDVHPPAHFQLPPQERARIVEEYGSMLFGVVLSERSRVQKERENGAAEARCLKGYVGPNQGFPLSIDIMLMDAITDFKRRQKYFSIAASAATPDSPITIPDRIGRRYDRPDRFFGLQKLPERLARLSVPRTLEVTIYDPTSDAVRVITENSPDLIEQEIRRTNLSRLSPVVDQELAALLSSTGASDQAAAQRIFALIERQRGAVGQAQDLVDSAIAERNAQLPSAGDAARAAGHRGKAVTNFVRAAREEHEAIIQAQQEELSRHEAILLQIYASFIPGRVAQLSERIERILDERIAKFIYSIGADEQVILDQEELTPSGPKRSSHSELLGGRNMYAGGEIVVGLHQEAFSSVAAWKRFDQHLRTNPSSQYYLFEINNASGHYQPFATTLRYAANLIKPPLQALGIQTDDCQLVDRLAPGLRLRTLGNASI